MDLTFLCILSGLIVWISILLLPWRLWSTRESLDSSTETLADLSDVTVLIPARNEALTIEQTLAALKHGQGLKIVLVDDQSTDKTAAIAKSAGLEQLSIISGEPLPEAWSGKLWALEQGRQHIKTKYLLLLDADIVVKPGLIATLLDKAQQNKLTMISLMAHLRMESCWEKLLMPAFIFFFKLIYPFYLANKPGSRIAAAAGGCILLQRDVLEKSGGFSGIKDALIDDCALAKHIKQKGHRTWIGLTHSAISMRRYDDFKAIWDMVTRTAYTQLFYSPLLLLLCTLLMLIAFVSPVYALFQDSLSIVTIGFITLVLQYLCYYPICRYYSMHFVYLAVLPLIGVLYLVMTWGSAFNYYFGKGARWKGRHYA